MNNDTPRSIEQLLQEEGLLAIRNGSDPVNEEESLKNGSYMGSNLLRIEDFDSWLSTIKENFPALTLPAEVGMSMFGQLLVKDVVNPCAVVFTDVPSAGKTIVLNMFAGLPQTYITDSFSPAAFVSQAANVAKDKLKEVDLLPKIRNKVMIVRDLAPMFGQRDDDLLKSMGVLTRVMDGEGLKIDAGVHGSRGYEGDYNFMLLAASTPIPPKIFKLMGNLGSRLFFINLQSKSKDINTLVEQLVHSSWKEKQKACKESTHAYVSHLYETYPEGIEWQKESDPKEVIEVVALSAKLLSRLRGSINIWKDVSREGEYEFQEPIIEQPDRISQIFYNLTRGHALVSGRQNISKEDLKLIINIAFDSAPPSRTRVFRILIENGGLLNTSELMERLNCSDNTALKEMEVLKILKIVDIGIDVGTGQGKHQKMMELKKEFKWFVSEECRNLIKLNI